MDPSAVAAYYRGKGYVVRDNARVPTDSGGEHKVPLLAEGPLGSLAVFFGDFGGVDGPEMGGARKVAREVGATPVLAADEFSNQDRQVAARLGVVLLDAATLQGEGAPATVGLGADTGRAWPGLAPVPARRSKEPADEPHPWPASGRVGGRDGPGTRAVDVDEILAPRAAAIPESAAGDATSPVGAGGPTDALAPASDEEVHLDGLWKRPRSPAAPPRQPRTAGSRPFAWLGGSAEPGPATPPGGRPASASSSMAVEYDDVVPAKGPSARGAGESAAGDAGEGGDDDAAERLGESIELQPTLEELDRQARRDRLLRRLFWILFASVLLYLFTLWWF